MEHFELLHDHGEKSHTAALCRELGKTGHFAAVSDVFKQLSDSNRVRIFWLLSHQEACVVNIAAMLEMRVKEAFPPIALGVVTAGIIVAVVTYGAASLLF